MRWNWAADFAANDLIASTTDSNGRKIFTPLPGWLLNVAWHDESAEQILHQTAGTAARRRARREARTGDNPDNPDKGQGKVNPAVRVSIPDRPWTTILNGKTLPKTSRWKAKEQDWKDRVAKASVEARRPRQDARRMARRWWITSWNPK